jgi:hypothetical protein
MSKYVAIENDDGEIEIHLPHPTGDYATLCGADGDDPELGMYPASVPNGAKVNCDACFHIWLTAKPFTAKDFAAPNKSVEPTGSKRGAFYKTISRDLWAMVSK